MFFDHCIGLGAGGTRIIKEFNLPSVFLNFAQVDHEYTDDNFLILETGGTGRDPSLGAYYAKGYQGKIESFLDSKITEDHKNIIIACGGGGGSGCGLLETVIQHMLEKNKKILLIYTLPEKKEKLPGNLNALKSLNEIINLYLKTGRITMLLIDNDFCLKKYKNSTSSSEYWADVNKKIISTLDDIQLLSENRGNDYGTLDELEAKRVLLSGGLLDIRKTVLKNLDMELSNFKFEPVLNNRLRISSAKACIINVGISQYYKNDKRIPEFLSKIFGKVKAQFVLRSSYYDRKSNVIKITLIAGGLDISSTTNLVNQIQRDIDKMKKKSLKAVDISKVGRLSI